MAVAAEIAEAAVMTEYAVATRYHPGDVEPITDEEYREAVEHAERVVRWAEDTGGGVSSTG